VRDDEAVPTEDAGEIGEERFSQGHRRGRRR
jgi:hypothetical protein